MRRSFGYMKMSLFSMSWSMLLIRGWKTEGICESKRHDQVFKVTEKGVEGCLPLISFLIIHQVVDIAQVHFGEDGGFIKRTKESR